MKGTTALWEDLVFKGTKLHQILRATSTALAVFVDVIQKIADIATGAKGATKDIGSALTRLCFRHRSLENKLRTLSSSIVEHLTSPLQNTVEIWKKNASQLDKQHAKEQKRLQHEIRRLSAEVVSHQSKLRKGKIDSQVPLDSTLKELKDRRLLLEEMERSSVKSALIEERSRFCTFIGCLKPIADIESSMSVELTSVQEVVDSLCLQSADPHLLPDSSLRVIDDMLQTQCKWFCQTPPGSRSVSPHRSSFSSSLSSLNSTSSTGPQSPNHCITSSAGGQTSIRSAASAAEHFSLSSSAANICSSTVSSRDSGFVSHEARDQVVARQDITACESKIQDEDSMLSQAIAQLTSNSTGLDDMLFTSSQAEDNLDDVMHQLELSTAALFAAEAKLDNNSSRNSVIVADRGRPSVLPRRVSMLSATSRPKPPPPIRRTSSVVSSNRTSVRQDMSNAPASRSQKTNKEDSPSTVLMMSTSRRIDGQSSPSTVGRTLSSTYADVIQTLNSQLSPTNSVAPSTVRRPYRRALTTTSCDEDSRDGGRIIALSGTMPHSNNRNNSNLSLMTQIQRGVLRQSSVTNDRSAPRF